MSQLKNILRSYGNIEPAIRNAIAAQFCIQSVNTSFFLLLNYYMAKEGYEDFEIAEVLSRRFLAVFLLAFPIGLFIKGRRLKPFFYTAAVIVPISSNLILLAVDQHWDQLLYAMAMLWGVAYTCMQITILPFILLNAKQENHSEAISLSFLSFSVTICTVGVLYYVLHFLQPILFNERLVLHMVATISVLSLYFISKIQVKEQLSAIIPFDQIRNNYDWKLILSAVLPTVIIAVGAGFTIPVINLFFLNVHGLDSETFSLVGSATFFLVACVMIFMPYVRRRFGYSVAITLFQSLAVLALFILATTEYYQDWEYAAGVAILFYILRQPLMNAAGPMASELTMYYVGKRNQEIISALNASIWSGSWFISMKIFAVLRQMEFRYVSIFLITVIMYIIGVAWYAYLIRLYKRRTGETGKELQTDPSNGTSSLTTTFETSRKQAPKKKPQH